jgi:hypothetical protein
VYSAGNTQKENEKMEEKKIKDKNKKTNGDISGGSLPYITLLLYTVRSVEGKRKRRKCRGI